MNKAKELKLNLVGVRYIFSSIKPGLLGLKKCTNESKEIEIVSGISCNGNCRDGVFTVPLGVKYPVIFLFQFSCW